jgi:hypothetical protein
MKNVYSNINNGVKKKIVWPIFKPLNETHESESQREYRKIIKSRVQWYLQDMLIESGVYRFNQLHKKNLNH